MIGSQRPATPQDVFTRFASRYDRMNTIERIVQADNPNWRSIGRDPVETVLEDRTDRGAELSRSNRPARRN